jgi:hypothetical protein
MSNGGKKLTPQAITEAIRRGDLTIADCVEAASAAQPDPDRVAEIVALAGGASTEGETEVDDNAIVSEGDDNGAYVSAWVWVSFAGTRLDKEADTALGVFNRANAAGKPLDCYMVVRECRSGQEWVRPIRKREKVDLEALIRKWAKEEFNGELRLDGKLMPKLEGDYYARIITDGRPPDSVVVWASGGFYLKGDE